MLKSSFDSLDAEVNRIATGFITYLKLNTNLIFGLISIALCAYGFELFNFNLTIDEEVHANYSSAVVDWISQGRWGMYILNKLLLPHTIIPFVPLFVAILFHIGAILMFVESWKVETSIEKIIVGSIGLTFPIISYMYTFSTINYGVGAGLFFVALSVFLFSRLNGNLRFLAILPAAFSIAIYQGFIPALAAAYLIYILLIWIRSRSIRGSDLLSIAAICVLALLVYLMVQKTIMIFGVVKATNYVSQYIDTSSLRQNLGIIISRILSSMFLVYSGDVSIYAIKLTYLKFLILFLFLGFVFQVVRAKLSILHKFVMIFLGLSLLFLPFLSGIILGYIAMRFFVALPVVMMGLTTLGIGINPRLYISSIGLLTAFCVFQFIVSTNYLFGSSHLALQADRVLASQLIERIELEKTNTDTSSIQLLDLVGYYSRPSTPLMPKTETFGASFFEWDEGNPGRIVLFLQTLGYYDLQVAPIEKSIELIELTNTMPAWPAKDSVKIVDNIVVVKFGPYSGTQKLKMCNVIISQKLKPYRKFCK